MADNCLRGSSFKCDVAVNDLAELTLVGIFRSSKFLFSFVDTCRSPVHQRMLGVVRPSAGATRDDELLYML